MQFITDGPDIPTALLQAHEEGKVVFFCGAGISVPAGLPSFKGLVNDIYKRLGTDKTPIERESFERGQFDATLDLLERRIPGQRISVRTALAQALQPKLRRKGAIDSHTALLQLAKCRDGALRLVTTNFDHVFEKAAQRAKQQICTYAAPMLPIPKSSRWDGLVYLHGRLSQKKNEEGELHRLVLTSGDFGIAYLTERWAARFVSELFRNYIVCFVGYSINDPVMRYMMDALAADRMLGEITPQAYAFGDCEPGQEDKKTIEWKAKGVAPILYQVPINSFDHSALHKTLKVWAEIYRDGILGKERIVVDYALARPSASTPQENFVGRMLWALSHESGLPAKRFAEFNPVPSLEWLTAFSEECFQHGDLIRFGVPPHATVDAKLKFSLIRRPASYTQTPWMELVIGWRGGGQWDNVMVHLARWLVRHLNDPELIIWLAERGGHFHDGWSRRIEDELDRFERLEKEGKTKELEEIKANAPNAIPGPLMQTLWRLLLTGRVKSSQQYFDLYRWKDRFKRYGLTTSLRGDLRDLLAAKIKLRRPFNWRTDAQESVEPPTSMRQLMDWELVLAADHVHSIFRDRTNEHWNAVLPILLSDFQLLLIDALDLFRELDGANYYSDRSSWDLPSISPHWQNNDFHDWVILIELIRDAWLATHESDPVKARRIAQDWFDIPYPTFKRLALFAASFDGCIESNQWVEWLVTDRAVWLWDSDTKREVMRLLVSQSASLSSEKQIKLETVILSGPPTELYPEDIEPDRWQSIVDHAVWLRLGKLKASGLLLGEITHKRLELLSKSHPTWHFTAHQSEEFSHWHSGTGDPDFEDSRDIDVAPRTRKQLIAWLKSSSSKNRPFYEDTWRDTCRARFFHSCFALWDLTKEHSWPIDRWREALQVWSEDKLVIRSWHFAAFLVRTMPDDVLSKLINNVTWWLQAVSKSSHQHENILLDLCHRILLMPLESGTGMLQNGKPISQPVTEALNHPVGHITQALLDVWFKRKPNDNEKLSVDLEPLFTQLCDTRIERFIHGRVLLASRLISLFRVDKPWSEINLLPLFDWSRSDIEARAVWEGFLWSPRLYRPLLIAFKEQFLSTAQRCEILGEQSRQFVLFLTYVALEPIDSYTTEDFQLAFSSFSGKSLEWVAQALVQALEGSGEQREDYWKNRILPFWQKNWPKSRDLVADGIAQYLACLSIAAGQEFPTALSMVFSWLKPIEYPDYVVHPLYESSLCTKVPEDALRLLDALIGNPMWVPSELKDCLDQIVQAAPYLAQDTRYQRLLVYIRR